MNRWAPTGHSYNQPGGLTALARRPAFKWVALLVAWALVTALLSITHLGVLLLVIMAGLICYVVYAILRDTPRAGRPASELTATDHANRRGGQRTSLPTDWPEPSPDGQRPPGSQPDRSRHAAPPGWEFRVWPYDRARGQRVGRYHRRDRRNGHGA